MFCSGDHVVKGGKITPVPLSMSSAPAEFGVQKAPSLYADNENVYQPWIDVFEYTHEAQGEGFKVMAWTVNETTEIERMKSYDVDGIISDNPDRI